MDIDSALIRGAKPILRQHSRGPSALPHPAFGSLPKLEVELAVLRLLEDIGAWMT